MTKQSTPFVHAFQAGQLIVDGLGQVGMVQKTVAVAPLASPRVAVQYGATGPVKWWRARALRYATPAEITQAGLDGIGYVQSPAQRYNP